MFPVHVPLASALLGALLPERGVVGDHGGHEVVGGLLPRRGPAQGVRVQVARVAVVLQHTHCIYYYLHISTLVGTDLHGQPACPGPHVSLQQGLVRALVTAGSAGQRVPEQPGITIIIVIIASNGGPHKGS